MSAHVRFDPEVGQFLATSHTASLATVDDRGLPCACNIWYALGEQQRLYYVSSLDATHSRNIVHEPTVALTIYGDTDDPLHIHGVQIRGVCVAVPPPPEGNADHWQRAWDVYVERFPFVGESEMFRKAVETQCFFRVTPQWYRWLDSRKGFGFKYERTIERGGNGIGEPEESDEDHYSDEEIPLEEE